MEVWGGGGFVIYPPQELGFQIPKPPTRSCLNQTKGNGSLFLPGSLVATNTVHLLQGCLSFFVMGTFLPGPTNQIDEEPERGARWGKQYVSGRFDLNPAVAFWFTANKQVTKQIDKEFETDTISMAFVLWPLQGRRRANAARGGA